MFVKILGCPVHFCIKRKICGRVLTSFCIVKCIATFSYVHYSIMLATTLAHSLKHLQMLCTCLFTKLHGRQYMFNKYFMVGSRQQQAVHITFPTCLIRIWKNNHVIVRIGLTNKPCERWTGNRKSIWSGLIINVRILYLAMSILVFSKF